MSCLQIKYLPETHEQLSAILNALAEQIEYDESTAFSVMMPIISLSRTLQPGNTLEQGGLCLRQIAHCCRVMGTIEPTFNQTTLFVLCLHAMSKLGVLLGWYPNTIKRWQSFAQGSQLNSNE
ncbi:TPA: hypothetical protein ACN37W_003760 [Vibrio parahaemolyticus]